MAERERDVTLIESVLFLLDEVVIANLPDVERARVVAEVGDGRTVRAQALYVALSRAARAA